MGTVSLHQCMGHFMAMASLAPLLSQLAGDEYLREKLVEAARTFYSNGDFTVSLWPAIIVGALALSPRDPYSHHALWRFCWIYIRIWSPRTQLWSARTKLWSPLIVLWFQKIRARLRRGRVSDGLLRPDRAERQQLPVRGRPTPPRSRCSIT